MSESEKYDTPERESDPFPQTRWSLILNAKTGEEAKRHRAFSELCEIYWYPLYAYLRRLGLSAASAEDTTQGFFHDLIRKDSLQLFSAEKGKLRAYLLSSIKNYLTDQRRHQNAEKRGGAAPVMSLDFRWDGDESETRYALEPREFDTPERLFDRRWALTLMERVMERVESEYISRGKEDVFSALCGHLSGSGEAPLSEISEALKVSEGAVRVSLHRMRKRYKTLMREEIADTLGDGESVEEEIQYLSSIFRK